MAGRERKDKDSFEQFAETTRKIFVLAQEEALRFGHSFIGTEHLLLGLLREGTVAEILSPFGINEDKIHSAIDSIIGRGYVRPSEDEIGLTPRAKRSIEKAVGYCRSEGDQKITPVHLLEGIIKEKGGLAAGILDASGVNPKTLEQEIRIGPVLKRLRTTLETMDQEAGNNLIRNVNELIEGAENKS